VITEIGKGSPIDFLLAYGWAILLFVMLIGSVGIGVYWIAITLKEKIQKDQGVKRIKTIALTTVILIAIGLAVWRNSQPLN
jgi:hypothetical protein